MRTRQLEYFVAICETGSITRAAESLNVAQPALGTQIKALENEFGIKLLDRTRRGTRATEAGEMLLDEARHLLARIRDLKRRLREMDETHQRTVMIGLPPSLATVLTGRLLTALSSKQSPIKLQIFEEFSHTLLSRISQKRLDLALAYSVPIQEFPQSEMLLREVLYFVASPQSPLGGEGPISLQEVTNVPLVMPSERDYVRRVVEAALRGNNCVVNIAYQVESMAAMKDLIRRGMAYSILPYGNLIREIGEGSLCARRIVDPPISRTLYLVRSGDAASETANLEVIALLRQFLPEICSENPALSML